MAVATEPRPAVPPARRRRNDPRGLVTTFVGYAILIFFGLVFLYPFVIQLANAFKTEADAAANPLSPFPDPVTTDSVARIFTGTDFPLWLGNSRGDHDHHHGRPGLPRLAGRLRPGAAALRRPVGASSPRSSR